MPCSYRIAQEGLPLLLPHITRQRLTLSSADFLRLLTERSLPLPPSAKAVAEMEMSDGEQAPPPANAAAAVNVAAGSAEDAEAAGPDDAAEAAAAGGAEAVRPDDAKASGGAGDAAEVAAASAAGAAVKAAPQKGKGEPTAEKPRGPPLDDEATLAQLADIGNGCCVATLR